MSEFLVRVAKRKGSKVWFQTYDALVGIESVFVLKYLDVQAKLVKCEDISKQ